ncbi:MAG: Asp-tRNA(Asn)/Glu-tRNA(Gln) amidotransferase GatCAB subunit C, partial [Arthrobacter sp.]|nr:Asp-tRNA(Asn)/Glu-tRNA(Gln) amidotransferase GatCAB subunit C [Arthrobacter sp.]
DRAREKGLEPEHLAFYFDFFRYGAPPHGGIALGWDRVVSFLAGAESIRDVIAFPKSGGGYDPLTAAPAPITPQQRKEAGVDFKPAPKAAAAEKPAGETSDD